MIHFIIVQAIYLPSRVTGQEKLQISAGPNSNQYPIAPALCKSSGKPSTRFALGEHVELETLSDLFFKFNRHQNLAFCNALNLISTHISFIYIDLNFE